MIGAPPFPSMIVAPTIASGTEVSWATTGNGQSRRDAATRTPA